MSSIEERLEIAQEFIDGGHPRELVIQILSIPKSSYYHKGKKDPKPKGRPVSTKTFKTDGSWVDNAQVVKNIEEILAVEFVDYGYLKMTHALRQDYDYIINSKKVYRLMGENQLLNIPTKTKPGKRQWVKELVPKPDTHFSYIEFDIKYIWIQGMRRNALLLTAIDVDSRWVLGQYLAWQIREKDIIRQFDQIFDYYPMPEKIYVRNDNGPQMVALKVQKYFAKKNVTQEFTKPATPEQNAHIESYHSIIERVVCQKYEFDTLEDAGATMTRFVKFYNYKRIHSGINYLSPYNYLLQKGTEVKVHPSLLEAFFVSNTKIA